MPDSDAFDENETHSLLALGEEQLEVSIRSRQISIEVTPPLGELEWYVEYIHTYIHTDSF